MLRLILVLGACGAVAGSEAELKKQVLELQEEIKQLKAKLDDKCGAEHLSVVGAARKAWGLGGAIVSHALDQTTVDEQVASHVEAAMTHAAKVKEQVVSVDYNGYVEQVKTSAAPHFEKLATTAEPYIQQYVNPALDQAYVHADPAMKKVKEIHATTSKSLQEDVLPVLKRSSSQAFDVLSDAPKHVDYVHSILGRFLSPIFDTCKKIAPGHASALPKEPVDQLLFLICSMIVCYNLFFLFMRLVRWALLLLGIKLKVVKFSVKIPLKIIRFALGVAFWFLTLFYCCGLCRSRKAKKEKATTNGKDAAKKDEKETKKKIASATEKEVSDLLTSHKKDPKKLEAVAKKLVKFAKSGKEVPAGETDLKTIAGKKVAEDVVGKAVRKFKELDINKLSK